MHVLGSPSYVSHYIQGMHTGSMRQPLHAIAAKQHNASTTDPSASAHSGATVICWCCPTRQCMPSEHTT